MNFSTTNKYPSNLFALRVEAQKLIKDGYSFIRTAVGNNNTTCDIYAKCEYRDMDATKVVLWYPEEF